MATDSMVVNEGVSNKEPKIFELRGRVPPYTWKSPTGINPGAKKNDIAFRDLLKANVLILTRVLLCILSSRTGSTNQSATSFLCLFSWCILVRSYVFACDKAGQFYV